MENKELWSRALVDIELEVSKANFSTWFKKRPKLRIAKRQGRVAVFPTGRIPTKPVRGVYRSATHPDLIVVDKENGGKADAMITGGAEAAPAPEEARAPTTPAPTRRTRRAPTSCQARFSKRCGRTHPGVLFVQNPSHGQSVPLPHPPA